MRLAAVPVLKAPLVLLHGLGGDRLSVAGRNVADFWPKVGDTLRAAGNRVFRPALSPTGGIAERAGQLARYLDEHVPHEPVHVIAYSMGGLDTRHLISKLGYADRILTLTTVGTPHRGSPLADLSTRRFGTVIRPVFRWLGTSCQAFFDLTTEACRRFNDETLDAPNVRYFSVGGRCHGAWLDLGWVVPNAIVAAKEGDNDGVVSLQSARWGESIDVWDGDHLNLINWPNLMACVRGVWQDRTPQYVGLVQRLADEGY